jgi:YVTN family beta-propeller protein
VINGSGYGSRAAAVVATVPVGATPYAVAADPCRSRVYVANFGDNTVSVIGAPRSDPVVATVPVGDEPDAVAVDPGTGRVYVTNAGDNTVSLLEGRR